MVQRHKRYKMKKVKLKRNGYGTEFQNKVFKFQNYFFDNTYRFFLTPTQAKVPHIIK